MRQALSSISDRSGLIPCSIVIDSSFLPPSTFHIPPQSKTFFSNLAIENRPLFANSDTVAIQPESGVSTGARIADRDGKRRPESGDLEGEPFKFRKRRPEESSHEALPMLKQSVADSGYERPDDIRYSLEWESLPANRDTMRTQGNATPSMLQLVERPVVKTKKP